MNRKKLQDLVMLSQISGRGRERELQERELSGRDERGRRDMALGLIDLISRQDQQERQMQLQEQELTMNADRYAQNAEGQQINNIMQLLGQGALADPALAANIGPFLEQINPAYRGVAEAGRATAQENAVRKLTTGVLFPLYQANRGNISELQKGLAGLEASTPKGVWDAVDWNALNATLPGAASKPLIPISDYPSRGRPDAELFAAELQPRGPSGPVTDPHANAPSFSAPGGPEYWNEVAGPSPIEKLFQWLKQNPPFVGQYKQ